MTLVRVDSDGGTKEYVYNVNEVLGAGQTSIVYAGRDRATGEAVAVKVARAGGSGNFQSEANILKQLSASGSPGARFVPWAAMGQELSRETAAPCMVMERIDNDRSLALQLSELGGWLSNQNAQYPQAKILQKEYVAAQSGWQYAQLLMTMQAVGVITRGDRKATDFRWLPDGEGRLIVLDWNRAEHIDLAALDPTRFDESYIARRKAQLERGTLDDIRNFAHWWVTFLLGRAVQGPLLDRDDPEPAWQALTLAMRTILLRGEAAGQPEGFASSNELAEALTQHLELLLLPVEELARRILAEEWRRAPRPLDALLQLIDLAERRHASARQLDDWRRLADREQVNTLIYARQIVHLILTDLLPQRRWKEIAETVAKALRSIGPLSATNAAAYLVLHRWDIAARLDLEPLNPGDADKWARLIATALQAMDGSTGGGWSTASDNLRSVASVAPGQNEALRPLRLEIELRQGGPSVEKWDNLNSLDERYADALRLSWPELNANLSFKAQVGERAAQIGDSRADLHAAIKALAERYVNDVNLGKLPPPNRRAAGALYQAYQPLLAEFYTRASQYQGDGNEHERWRALIQPLDALLAALQRGRLDDAVEFLGAGRPDWAAAMDDLSMSGRRVTTASETIGDNILRRLLDLAPEGGVYGGEPRWPYELEQAVAAAGKLAENGPAALQPQARALQQRLEPIKRAQDALRGRLGADTAADWEHFARQVVESEDEAIDSALQEAMDARLEVWAPRPPAEDASDPDGSAHALEAYRVKTLQALRTIQQLPKSLRTFSQKLVEEAEEIEAQKPRLGEIITFYRDYPHHLATLTAQRHLVKQQVEAMAQQRNQAEAEQQQAESDRSAVERVNQELSDSLRALKETRDLLGRQEVTPPVSHPSLAALWVTRSIEQAVDLDLDAAEKSLALARQLLGQSQEPRPAPVGTGLYGRAQPAAAPPTAQEAPEQMSDSVAATVEMVAKDLATLRVWQVEDTGQAGMRRLDQLRQALAKSDRYSAKLALEELKAGAPNWRANVILARLNERFEQLPQRPAPAPSGTPGSGYSNAPLPITPGIGDTSRLRLEPPPESADRAFDDLIAQWEQVASESPQRRNALPFLPDLVTRTDGFYRSASCSPKQKKELMNLVSEAAQGMDQRSPLSGNVRALWRGIERSLAATSR